MLVIRKKEEINFNSSKNYKSNITNSNNNNNIENKTYDIPEEYINALQHKILIPFKDEIINLMDKLEDSNMNQKISKNTSQKIIKTIIDNRNKLISSKKQLDGITTIEIMSGLTDYIDIGSSTKLVIKNGSGLDFNKGRIFYRDFCSVIREYIFDYSQNYWPPRKEDINMFVKDDPDFQKVCCYWPIYGYIILMFHKDFKDVDILKIFSKQYMDEYRLKDPFTEDKKPEKKQQPQQKGKYEN